MNPFEIIKTVRLTEKGSRQSTQKVRPYERDKNGKPVFYMVPASDRFSDFAQSITYLITTLSEIEDRHPVDILNDILRHQSGEAQDLGVEAHPDKQSRTA